MISKRITWREFLVITTNCFSLKINGDVVYDFVTDLDAWYLSSLTLITELHSIEIWETAQIIQKNNRLLVKLKHTMYYLHVQNSI